MSGIYIPGLKDLSCDDCFWGIGSRLGCHATPEAVTRKINGRAADCPLIFLEGHGRLVDASVLMEDCMKEDTFLAEMLFRKLSNAPTIIPADHFRDATKMMAEGGEG